MTSALGVQELLGLRVPPVAIAYLAEPPAGLRPWQGPAVAAGCVFWQRAQQGESFYTVPSDHYNCAIGSFTHGIELPPQRAAGLQETVGFMVANSYLDPAEVAQIPRLGRTPAAIAYGPADAAAFAPDAVLIVATPAQAMLAYEAALRAGAGSALTNLTGRPSCAVLPLAISDDSASMSLGCAGNRLYTGLREEELYIAIPGGKWQAFQSAIVEVIGANARMKEFYEANEARAAVEGG